MGLQSKRREQVTKKAAKRCVTKCTYTQTILMDEPITYLDVRHQLEVMDVSRRLAAEGKAVVLVLHDLCMALQCADRVAVLKEGGIVQTGAPEQIYSSRALERVMGVTLRRVKTEGGWRYYYLS